MKTARKGRQSAYISIRSKLVAAVAMLLVASFMVVSSSYAWFTLSTAPEVKGIETQVGANGNLEIALDNGQTPQNATSSSNATNYTWGNLVNLASADLGLDQIKLMPTRLNVTDGTLTLSQPLLYPEYAADGRVSKLSPVTSIGYYVDNGFKKDAAKTGVIGIGNATSMSAEQVDYATALSRAKTALETAQRNARLTLDAFGGSMASIAATHAQAGDTDNNKYDLTSVRGTLIDLQGVVAELDNLALNYIRASVASAEHTDYATEKAPYYASDIDADDLNTWITTTFSSNTTLKDAWQVRTYVNNAVTGSLGRFPTSTVPGEGDGAEATTVVQTTNLTWDQTRDILTGLADINTVTIAGYAPGDVMANADKIMTQYMENHFVTVVLNPPNPENPNTTTGDGVYCELAKVLGNFSVNSKIFIKYNDLDMDVDAKMTTNVAIEDMVNLIGAIPEAPTSSDTSSSIINDLYGYALELVFRTNAKDSHLMLQTEAVDRIYTGNSNEQTMGSGSKMTYKISDEISAANQDNLLKAIRIVFAQDADIVAIAGLDTEKKTTEGNEISAPIKVFDDFDFVDGKLIVGDFIDSTDGKTQLIGLTQNQEVRLTAYVYLDGDYVTNADVAYSSRTSLTGTMSLQFSSDAKLVPMDYSPLKSTTVSGGSTETPAESTQTPAESTEP